MKPLYLALGFLFLGLGIAGTVIPGLPTTPLLLLALWAFSKSSQRFHDWLYNHPRYGPPLVAWRRHRVIPLKAKRLAVGMMSLSLLLLLTFSNLPTWALLSIAALMLYGCYFILSKPSQPPGGT